MASPRKTAASSEPAKAKKEVSAEERAKLKKAAREALTDGTWTEKFVKGKKEGKKDDESEESEEESEDGE